MGLVRPVVGILTEDYHLHCIKRSKLEGVKDLRCIGVDHLPVLSLTFYELSYLFEVWLLTLTGERIPPGDLVRWLCE